MSTVAVSRLIEKMGLVNLTPDIDVKGRKITIPDINRPALQLAGYLQHYEAARVQIIGFVEATYMEGLDPEDKKERYEHVLSHNTPCFVFCREIQPDPTFVDVAREKGVPILVTKRATSDFMAEIIRWLNVKLAPCISIHGVLVDVYGVGVLITGESGIGKSETAIELIKRGHRLVSDDAVLIRKVSEDTLIGSAPEVTKHL
ncbi:MAG: HPr(Ser) kinase/phosphatase, partial [Lachnospiraceae bacterium]|nr:HPr(Ser) kinase/phosphatase [Lachnospiraceae bacterium]